MLPPIRCLFGRGSKCDYRVDDPRVSSVHALLEWTQGHWELRDLGSRNGTFVEGKKLGAGERQVLPRGTVFTLGSDHTFVLEDASAPPPTARHAKTGALRIGAEGLLVLPSDDHPEVSVFEDATGVWVAEDADGTRAVSDQDRVIADGEEWILDLPISAGATVTESIDGTPTLESIAMRFAVSRDEEHIEVTIVHHGGKTAELPARTHHYLLLTLARAHLADEAASPAERGWVDRELLCRMLATDSRRLNVDVFRIRKQLSDLGIHGATGIIARRPGTGQLRLGTPRVEVTRL